ncbi:MAG: type II toxin-antitoxin system RelE/ParE family toxin [Candidatus Woesearchaeota archaeon]
MRFELQIDKKSIQALEKFPKELRHRIFDKIIDSTSEPFRYFQRLEGCTAYRMRVGNYRIIADIEGNIILVRLIGHRRQVYK